MNVIYTDNFLHALKELSLRLQYSSHPIDEAVNEFSVGVRDFVKLYRKSPTPLRLINLAQIIFNELNDMEKEERIRLGQCLFGYDFSKL
jgi:hypothetical protein